MPSVAGLPLLPGLCIPLPPPHTTTSPTPFYVSPISPVPSSTPCPLSGTHPHTAETHFPWSLPRRRSSSARSRYPPTPFDTIDQALPTLMGWGEPAPLWCGHNSLVASAWGGYLLQ
jgi:hypothetical protein